MRPWFFLSKENEEIRMAEKRQNNGQRDRQGATRYGLYTDIQSRHSIRGC